MGILSGVVLEKHKGFAIILTADGQFKKIKVNENYEVGQEVFGKEFSSRSGMYRRIAGSVAVAATLIMAVFVPGMIKEDTGSSNTIIASSEKKSKTVVAYVKVDINPSLQLGVDEQLLVKEAIPLNKDGERVLAEAQLNNHNISDAMELVTESCYELGYISENKENVVNLTLISDPLDSGKINKAKLEQDVQTKVKEVLVDKNLKGEVKDFKELTKAPVEKAVKIKNNKKGNGNSAEPTTSDINVNSNNSKKDAKTESERTNSKDNNKSKTKNESKEQVKDNSEKGLGKQNPSTGNRSEAKQDKKVKAKQDSTNINSSEKSSSGNKGSSKTNPTDNKATKEQEDKDNKESKGKEKGKFGDNELGSRLPWYKIFELG